MNFVEFASVALHNSYNFVLRKFFVRKMEDPKNIQVLAKASTEVDESQTRMNLVSLCIKAQQDLANKLRKESQRRKEICNFIQNNNLQLETEIKNAETEIKRSQINYEAIRSANVELKKELLLARKNNLQLTERMQKGERKYEKLWLECKSRYESIPFIQKFMQATKKAETLKEELVALDKETEKLTAEIETKQSFIMELDRKQIIKLAAFVINEMPTYLKSIKEKSDEINQLNAEIEMILKEKDIKCGNIPDTRSVIAKMNLQQPTEIAMVVNENWPNLSTNTDDILMMPRLELASAGIDVLSVKLELNKIPQTKIQIKRPDYATDFDRNLNKRSKVDESLKKEEFISPYFKKSLTITSIDDIEDDKTDNYSKKKLINILEDIRLNESETYNIVSKINTDDLQEVEVISSDASKTTKVSRASPEAMVDEDNEDIEIIDLTKSNEIIFPPKQFLDMTQEKVMQDMQVMIQVSLDEPSTSKNNLPEPKTTQEIKKKVSFDIPMTIQEIENDSADVSVVVEPSQTPNQTMTSQLEDDIASETNDNYMKIKDMILKKHNLDLSPQFVYAKNSILQKNENTVISKFFEQPKHTDTAVKTKTDETILKAEEVKEKKLTKPEVEASDKVQANTVDVDEPLISPPSKERENPVTGFLFNHGPQGLPESLDISMSTTGFEGDPEYPHCLDASLLLSPKGDDQVPGSENNHEIGSQEIPNFLSGFRKTGLSFFGQKPASETNAENAQQNQENNFNFNFDGQEKKSKGGLFSFFR